MEIFILPLIIVALFIIPPMLVIKGLGTPKKKKIALVVNLCSFFAVLLVAAVIPFGNYVGASDASSGETTSATDESSENDEGQTEKASGIAAGLGYLAAALATGVGSIGCGIAVGSAAPAAIGATAEEPKTFSKALIFVALGEGVALYGFLISFMILQKL